MAVQAALLADGRRLHLQHGPIDLVIEAFGAPDEVRSAYVQARRRFETVLPELVEELASLRKPLGESRWTPAGPVARRMADAVAPHAGVFVTPMAAVAGAVADEVLAATIAGRTLERAYINNSGDIAFHLAPGATFRLGIVSEMFSLSVDGAAEIRADMAVRGVATSGWQGRSFSLGIADSVTVLAKTAAAADVAATLIANAVDADDPAVERRSASALDPDSDLGDRLVTTSVGPLDSLTVAQALDRGRAAALDMRVKGLISGAALMLRGQAVSVGEDAVAALNTDSCPADER